MSSTTGSIPRLGPICRTLREVYTDREAIERTTLGQASRWQAGKYSKAYFQNRKLALQRDKYT